jgi:hypothetical protein
MEMLAELQASSFYPSGKSPGTDGWESGWTSQPVWTLWRTHRFLSPSIKEPRVLRCPARSLVAIPAELSGFTRDTRTSSWLGADAVLWVRTSGRKACFDASAWEDKIRGMSRTGDKDVICENGMCLKKTSIFLTFRILASRSTLSLRRCSGRNKHAMFLDLASRLCVRRTGAKDGKKKRGSGRSCALRGREGGGRVTHCNSSRTNTFLTIIISVTWLNPLCTLLIVTGSPTPQRRGQYVVSKPRSE